MLELSGHRLFSIMETERLIFRQYQEEDKDALIQLFTDVDVMKHVGDGVVTTEEVEKIWTNIFEKYYAKNINSIWIIFAKDDNRHIGHATLSPRSTKKEDWELSYILRKEEWGKGFATEIARKIVDYGFNEIELNEIYATIDDDHFNSIKVLEKIGMKFERFEYDEQGRYSVYVLSKKWSVAGGQ